MKIASVTVTYNISEAALLSSIETYFPDVDLPIIWDNSPIMDFAIGIVAKYPQAIIIHDGTNHGLGEAYNRAIDIARQNGCTHLMTMDQDTFFQDFLLFRQWAENQHDNILHCHFGGYHNTDNETEIMSIWCQSATIFPLAMLEKLDFSELTISSA